MTFAYRHARASRRGRSRRPAGSSNRVMARVAFRAGEEAIGKTGGVESCNRRGNAAGKRRGGAAAGDRQKPSPDGARTNAQSCGECVSIICWNGARCPYAMPDTSSRQTAATRGENARCRTPS